MNIETVKVNLDQFWELAVDRDNGQHLLGVLKDHGASSYVDYYKITKAQFDQGMQDLGSLNDLVPNGNFHWPVDIYYSPLGTPPWATR